MLKYLSPFIYLYFSFVSLACFSEVENKCLINHYHYFSGLSVREEAILGVITPPASATKRAEYNGISIIDVESRRFTDEELQEIKRVLALVPKKMMETPPKAIIAASRETAGRVVVPNTVATASGPYIFIGDQFFKGGSGPFNANSTENDRVSVFMHEYAHVLQYYYLIPNRGKQNNLAALSSLVHQFGVSVGWVARDAVRGPSLAGDAIRFPPERNSRLWDFPEDQKGRGHGTTDYGENSIVEDMAESFAWVIAGHPQKLSDKRVAFVLDFLDEQETVFTRGVLPIHPLALRTKRQPRGTHRFFQDQEPEKFRTNKDDKSYFYFFDNKAPILFSIIVDEIDQDFKARGFTAVKPLESHVLRHQEDAVSAVYQFDEERVLLQMVGFENSTAYASKGNTIIRLVQLANTD